MNESFFSGYGYNIYIDENYKCFSRGSVAQPPGPRGIQSRQHYTQTSYFDCVEDEYQPHFQDILPPIIKVIPIYSGYQELQPLYLDAYGTVWQIVQEGMNPIPITNNIFIVDVIFTNSIQYLDNEGNVYLCSCTNVISHETPFISNLMRGSISISTDILKPVLNCEFFKLQMSQAGHIIKIIPRYNHLAVINENNELWVTDKSGTFKKEEDVKNAKYTNTNRLVILSMDGRCYILENDVKSSVEGLPLNCNIMGSSGDWLIAVTPDTFRTLHLHWRRR